MKPPRTYPAAYECPKCGRPYKFQTPAERHAAKCTAKPPAATESVAAYITRIS